MTTGRYILKSNLMTRIVKRIKIDAPKNEVWKVVSDLGGIQNYNPTVKKSYYNTDVKEGVGAGRICEFHPMGKVDEKATAWKEGDSYTLHIKPIEKLPFFKEGNADFTLTSEDGKSTYVEVNYTYKTTSGIIGNIMNSIALKNNFNKAFEGILKGLKKHIEEGEIIENGSALKGYSVSFA